MDFEQYRGVSGSVYAFYLASCIAKLIICLNFASAYANKYHSRYDVQLS